MSNVSHILTKQQSETLQEVCSIIDSALCDERKAYPTKVIDENGTHDCISSREEYLEGVMDYALTALGCVFPQID